MRLDENIHRIKEVMGLITEAEQPSNAVEINLGNLFESGKYKLSQQAISSVNAAIIKLRDFAKKNPGKPVLVTVESSESKVPNYDREKFPSTGDRSVDFTSEKKLAVCALSALRAKTIEDYLVKNLRIPTAKVAVNNKGAQGPVWDGKNANDPKYTAKQYVKVFAKLNIDQPTQSPTPAATQKTEASICNQSFQSKGTYGKAEKGFIAEQMTINLGKGENTFYFLLEPHDVPDMLIIEYNNQTYSTGLVGIDNEINRLLIGTIVDNYFSTRPWYLKNLQIGPVNVTYADAILSKNYTQWRADDLKGWSERLTLKNGFFKEMANSTNIGPYMLAKGQIKELKAGESYWHSAQGLQIKKVEGVDTAKVSVVGMVGATKWDLYVKCGSAPYQKVGVGNRQNVEY
jgi:outer membrane protein OmpA-like peptidoglycan-associated protein